MFVNAAFAAELTRLETYKANNIIPSDFVMEDSKTATGDTVIEFDTNSLRWVVKGVAKGNAQLLEKYSAFLGLTKSDWEKMTWTTTGGSTEVTGAEADTYADQALKVEFLANILNGTLKPEEVGLSLEEAKAINFNIFKQLMTKSNLDDLHPDYAFQLTGTEDFSGLNLLQADLSNCTGITASQLMSANSIAYAKLPAVDLTGVDLTGKVLYATDFSRCTGLTGKQLVAAYDITASVLPDGIDFTGANFSAGKSVQGVDLSKCTGLTGEQLRYVRVDGMKCTTEQYNAWKNYLNFLGRSFIYIDGVKTTMGGEGGGGGGGG